MPATVALTRAADRYTTVRQAIELASTTLHLEQRQRVVIKPNLVAPERPLACTHMDALRAVLDGVRARYAGPLLIAEGAALMHTPSAFARLGYHELAQAYSAELVDLNADATVPVQVYDRQLRPQSLGLARTVVESDLRISVGPPKTHDTVIVTLSLKNMIMGALVNRAVAPQPRTLAARLRQLAARLALPRRLLVRLGGLARSDKQAMHQGFAQINVNLARLAGLVAPHLAVIDGWEAMEGAGPIHGDPVAWGIALAGSDALAVDTLTAALMGVEIGEVGYLTYLRQLGLGVGDLDDIRVVGGVEPAAVRRSFRRHPSAAQQAVWQIADVARLLPAPAGVAPLAHMTPAAGAPR